MTLVAMADDAYWEELNQASLQRELTAHAEVRAPWEAYPQIPRGSIGWRMGNGEGHLDMWWYWWRNQALSEAERIQYFARHRPIVSWLDWAGLLIWPASDGESTDYDEQREAAVARMETVGLGTLAEWRASDWVKRFPAKRNAIKPAAQKKPARKKAARRAGELRKTASAAKRKRPR